VTDDVIALIEHDHREVEQLFARIESRGADDALVRQVAEELIAHSKAEEEVVYPAIVAAASEEKGEVKDGAAEHHHIEHMLRQLLREGADAPGADGALAAIVAETKHHVEEEESDILPAFREKSTPEQRADLGRRFTAAKEQVKAAGIETAADPESGASAPSGDKTRDELYEEAKQAGVKGRSSMTKDELAQALDES
jgi:hemerythrin superfamily protein